MKARKPILQLSLEGKIIKRHESTYHAERETGIERTHILKVIHKRRRKTAGGYQWIYENFAHIQ